MTSSKVDSNFVINLVQKEYFFKVEKNYGQKNLFLQKLHNFKIDLKKKPIKCVKKKLSLNTFLTRKILFFTLKIYD